MWYVEISSLFVICISLSLFDSPELSEPFSLTSAYTRIIQITKMPTSLINEQYIQVEHLSDHFTEHQAYNKYDLIYLCIQLLLFYMNSLWPTATA